jgi:hypothetical protein
MTGIMAANILFQRLQIAGAFIKMIAVKILHKSTLKDSNNGKL